MQSRQRRRWWWPWQMQPGKGMRMTISSLTPLSPLSPALHPRSRDMAEHTALARDAATAQTRLAEQTHALDSARLPLLASRATQPEVCSSAQRDQQLILLALCFSFPSLNEQHQNTQCHTGSFHGYTHEAH